MKKTVMYEYLGTNGTILTPIHLENIYYVRKIKLEADNYKTLSNGEKLTQMIVVPEEEVDQWYEIDNRDSI